MLHTILLVILGLILIGAVSAVLEMLALRSHPYAARILAACIVGVVAYTHTWTRLIVVTVAALVYVGIRRDLQIRAQRRAREKHTT